jgi:oxygen-independent coproporphyrinogen-3 oxidase
MDSALRSLDCDVSLYVHVPFCEKICWYCGCNTGASNRRERLAAYLDSLHREVALHAWRLAEGVRVRRVSFGGGSPNAVTPTDFVRLVSALTLHLPLEQPVWSVELDPRSLPPEWGRVLAAVGVTRASLGVQTFDPGLQAAIGRVQPDGDIASATAMLREAGVTSLNHDLMYGLPGQTLAQLEATLRRSVALGADRIALFGYAHVPHLIPRQQRIDASGLPDSRARFAMAAMGHALLTAEGYCQVGFDHFALPGDPLAQAATAGRLHRNFQGFTDDAAPVLVGLGASAISCFPEVLVQNEKNMGRYRMMLSQDRLPAVRGIRRSAADRASGAIIEGLLCHGEARVEASAWRAAAPGLEPFLAHGLCHFDGERLRILPAGLPYSRGVAAQFDPHRRDSARRFSSAI